MNKQIDEKRRTVALYIRSAVRGSSILLQEGLLCGFLTKKGSPVYLARTKTFVDDGCSGLRSDRPGLNALLQAVKNKEVDAVIVVEQTRLARSLSVLAKVGAVLANHGCELWQVSTGNRVDLRTYFILNDEVSR